MYYSKHVCVYIKAIFRQSTLSLYFLILKCFCICARTQESKQAVSVANTQSIINSLLLSFPWSNHSTQQQWIPGSRSLDQWLLLLLLPLWENHKVLKRHTHKYLRQWEQVDLFDLMDLHLKRNQVILCPQSWTHDLTAFFAFLLFCF